MAEDSKAPFKFAVLPGDGIGPEVMDAALRVLEHAAQKDGFKFEVTRGLVGGAAIDAVGKALPKETIDTCEKSDAILFGSVGGPKWENLPPAEQPERAALLPLRKIFQLFANLRPGFLPPVLKEASPLRPELIPDGIDILCVRELTGGIYFGQPKATRTLDDGDIEAIDTMVYRKSEIERITDVAIKSARERSGRICSVDKANVLETSVLWRKSVIDYMEQHAPDLELSHMYVDNCAMQLVRNPNQFDVIVTENTFGDILSDEMSVICGSLGMMASASLGIRLNNRSLPYGLYEPAGGSAPDIAGQGVANPCAQVLSAAMMLRYSFGLGETASRIEKAVSDAVNSGTRTADIAFGGESVGTDAMVEAILIKL